MSRLVTRSVAGATLALLACACADSTRPVEVVEAAPTATATTQTTTSSDHAATAEDVGLMHDFVAFAVKPSARTAARLPLAAEVRLGLGPDLLVALDKPALAQAAAWVLEVESFRAYVGPFSALDLLQRNVDATEPASSRGGDFDVSVGEHPHCAGPPVPAPQGFGRYRRVSVQPSGHSIDSCLRWFTVDLFLNPGGRIAAVTLDIWEP